MSRTYTITVTEYQARAISEACEVLARLGIGQYASALDHLPWEEAGYGIPYDVREQIAGILRGHLIGGVDGHASSLGIRHTSVSTICRAAWDLHQVIRHRLAWDRAIDRGDTDGNRRDWSGSMIGVDYDDPMPASSEPLATMEAKPLAAEPDSATTSENCTGPNQSQTMHLPW